MKNPVMKKTLLLAFAALCFVQSALAWGKSGHDAVAYIAETHLTKRAKAVIERYLGHSIVYDASWMDDYRAEPGYEMTNWWHVDYGKGEPTKDAAGNPLEPNVLRELNRAIERMKKREAKVIMVNIKGGMVRINIANIYYIESQGHTLILHTILGDYETTGKMKEMDEKLSGMNFCRGNKGYLINLQHVDRIQDNCAVVKGEELVLSRARKKEFMEALTRYWGEVIK